MDILKSIEPTDELLVKLNKFTRREHTADEIYIFSVLLCDNEIDRDNERFTIPALEKLSELFVGKTGIFDHNPKSGNQTARIFECELFCDSSRTTDAGEPYTAVKAVAYMVRTAKTEDLIAEIEAGIKKEVSISCTVKARTCSICGANLRQNACQHRQGKTYGGKSCCALLDEPSDAYEWSFVAVPAQRAAGVTKAHNGDVDGVFARLATAEDLQKGVLLSCNEARLLHEHIQGTNKAKQEEICKQNDLIGNYREDICKDIIRLAYLSSPELAKAVTTVTAQMSIPELRTLREQYVKATQGYGFAQLGEAQTKENYDEYNEYKM